MDQSIQSIKSNNISLSHPTQTTRKPKYKFKKCNECNRKRSIKEIHQICNVCYKAKTVFIPSGNKVIDDFIWYTLTNAGGRSMRMEYVPYDIFKDVEFIAEGGFSKIYKATWIDGPISSWDSKNQRYRRSRKMKVALKELSNSKNINSKDLNELKIFYNFALNNTGYSHYSDGNLYNINKYYGITQHPNSQNFMIITKYYKEGDLTHYLTNNFFNINWKDKLVKLHKISSGLYSMHDKNIIHKDYHSGNIFIDKNRKNKEIAITGDLGLSKSSLDDNDNEIYGIIPYVAPEIFQGQKYTKASDIYGFGMIMWELMTGRRPFWDQSHDTDLIIKICDGLRPPIVTNAPEGYIELMQRCWHSDPNKRPTASKLGDLFALKYSGIVENEENPTIINIWSSDIGPITNNPNAVFKSRPLSAMIKSAKSTISLKSIRSELNKRQFNDIEEDDNNDDEDKITKKIKVFESENKNNEYLTKEFGFDIDNNINFSKSNNNGNDYNTKEIDFDI